MPVPSFDTILHVLPPHLGDPRQISDLSPYVCTVAEFCDSFATTAKRKEILEGFLKLRAELLALGIHGFQWLDGSFMENIESQEGRDPKDIDVVTFVHSPIDPGALAAILVPKPELMYPDQTRRVFFSDHYFVSLGSRPDRVVSQVRYWYALFSHRRDGQWKGMLEIGLANKADDDAAWMVLRSKP